MVRKYLEIIGRWATCGVVAVLVIKVLIAGLFWVAVEYDEYKMDQLLAGKAAYRVTKQAHPETGKESVHIVCRFSPYPAQISDEELEDAAVKTVLRIRRENPAADVIELQGQSEGFLDVDQCSGIYRKEKPEEFVFKNYGWTKLKRLKYEKVLRLPPE